MEVNGTALVRDADLGPGMHSLALCNVTQGNVSQVSFKIEVDNIKMGDNDLINIEFMGSNGTLNVKGTDVRTDPLWDKTNNAVTVSRTTAKATRALKDGDTEMATKLVTKLDTMGKTVPTAQASATILTGVTNTSDKGKIHEAIGTITVDETGKTVTRDN